MGNLFEKEEKNIPLAYKLRPKTLSDYEGQSHLVSPGKILYNALKDDSISSYIFWGPPGSGKTTLANIIAEVTKSIFLNYSAVLSGIKEIKEALKDAESNAKYYGKKTILFIDEIHRFNKLQQDAFLPYVENGDIILIGATTENPSFSINNPLLSRVQVLKLESLTHDELIRIFKRAVNYLKKEDKGPGLDEENLKIITELAKGDARVGLNIIENLWHYMKSENINKITNEKIFSLLQDGYYKYDKSGEEHYNLISAFHKSLRGSDPDAAVYYLMRMLKGGEDPLFIARRMIVAASEDIGNADPQALVVATSAKTAYEMLGSPEGELSLVHAAIYIATSPKSNAVYIAMKKARKCVDETSELEVPMHIRNAPTKLMEKFNYGKGYKYPHDFKYGFTNQQYLPEAIKNSKFYYPKNTGFEKKIRERINFWQNLKKS